MRAVDLEHLGTWARQRSLLLREEYPVTVSYLNGHEETAVRFDNQESSNLILLAQIIVDALRGVAPGKEVLFWIRERGIWNDVHEDIANCQYGTLLLGFGVPTESKGLRFSGSERHEAAVMTFLRWCFPGTVTWCLSRETPRFASITTG